MENILSPYKFHMLCRYVLQEIKSDTRIQKGAIMALREAAQAFLVYIFEQAADCAKHAKRVTVNPRDFQLVRNINKGTQDTKVRTPHFEF